MALFVQLEDRKGDQLWHTVASFEAVGGAAGSSRDFTRRYRTGCGLTQDASGDRMAEADGPPWTHRHVHKGCFTTASDKQKA